MESFAIGTQSYQSGIAEVTHKQGHGLTFGANYAWTKNLSDGQGTDAPTATASEEPYAVEIADRFHIKYDRGNVVATPRQRAMVTGTYALPFGKGQALAGPGFLNPVIGGWNLSTVTTMQTGQWLTPTDAGGRRSIEHQYDRAIRPAGPFHARIAQPVKSHRRA